MFNKIKKAITAIATREDVDSVLDMIDTAVVSGKITWKEHDTLFAIVGETNIY